MKNEQVEGLQQEERGTQQSEVMGPDGPGVTRDPKRELLSGIGLFIGTGLLGFWFGVGATLGAKMVNKSGRTYKRKIKWQKKIK